MSLLASGEIVEKVEGSTFDLRLLFPNLSAYMADDDNGGEENSDNGDEDGESEGEENGEEQEENSSVNDPDKKRLSDEAAKWRKKFRDTETELSEIRQWKKEQEDKEKDEGTLLSENLTTVTEERDELKGKYEETATKFLTYRAATKAGISDEGFDFLYFQLERDGKGLELEDGEIPDLEARVEAILKKNPHMAVSGSNEEEDESGGIARTSGNPTNGKRRSKNEANFETLANKFPALRR